MKSYIYKLLTILPILFIIHSCSPEISNFSTINYFKKVNTNDISIDKNLADYEHCYETTAGFQELVFRSTLYSKPISVEIQGYTSQSLHNPISKSIFLTNDRNIKIFKPVNDLDPYRFYGQMNNFQYYNEDGKEKYSVDLYTPMLFDIDTLKSNISRTGHLNMGNFHTGSSIYYNADKKNKNGLLIQIVYDGNNRNGSFEDIAMSQDRSYIEMVAFQKEDDGIIKFPKDFFDEIPNGGLVSIFVKRYNFSLFENENETHKIMTGTSIRLPLIINK